MAQVKELGVVGKNAPTKKSKSITASNFAIGGLIGFFERRYKKTFPVNNISEYKTIFGEQINSNWYGADAVTGFFNNAIGVNATLYIKSHVGNNGTTFDGVTATVQLDDQQTVAEKVLQLDSAYREELEFSESGNRTGYTITNGNRFSTTCTSGAHTTTKIFLNSVVGFIVGDIVEINKTAVEYAKVTIVNESEKSITVGTTLSAPPAVTDIVNVLGFRLRVYRKSITGIETEVDTALGEIWCTTESEVTDFYVENVFKTSNWIKASKLTTTPTAVQETFPLDVSIVNYLASGANGTSPTTVAQWDFDNLTFDGLPIRLIGNVETANDDIQKDLELYCKSRNDTPIVITHTLVDQDKQQLIDAGQGYQRSDDVFQSLIGTWLGVVDPFTTNPDAEDRRVPPTGHIIALWIRTISTKGIHYIPVKDTPIFGINSVVAQNLGVITNRDRTDIAQAGVNLVQNIPGVGFILRNMFTPSTSTDFQFLNGIAMRNFIKISIEDSLQPTENTPNSWGQIRADKDAIHRFMFSLWSFGSTRTVPTGETFGQILDEVTEELTDFDYSVEIAIDHPVNTQQSIQAGERNFQVYFRFPAPAGSIFINVGILL